MKFDKKGKVIWAKRDGGIGNDFPSSLSTDTNGSIYIAGHYDSTTVFGTITLKNSGAGTDMFIAKYDSNGKAVWAQSSAGTDDDGAYWIATDQSGNSYIRGSFMSDTISFGSSRLVNSNPGGADMFIAKYNSAGKFVWAQRAGGACNGKGLDWLPITTDNTGHIYISGAFFSDSLKIGNQTIKNTKTGSLDIFIAKLDANGRTIWLKKEGGIYHDQCTGISVDNKGHFVIAGFFNSPSITFGGITLKNSNSTISNDMFISKYDTSGTKLLWAKKAGGVGEDYCLDITTNNTGDIYAIATSRTNSLKIANTILINNGSSDIYSFKI
ncbi:MAG: hypothetical protein NTX03_01360 [Bacteroidetes bacterium]|nr:hypothetical protein [Bacteroidota bacterium]